jgi:hypothetical protein
MQHVDFGLDRCAPDYVPEPGQGVWVDMPESLKLPLARLQVLATGAEGVTPAQLVASYREGEPWLIRWPGKLAGEDRVRAEAMLACARRLDVAREEADPVAMWREIGKIRGLAQEGKDA